MVVVMVAWLALCGGREGGVVGRLWLGGCVKAVVVVKQFMRAMLVVEVVVVKRLMRAMLVVEVVVVKRLVQNNDSKRIMANSKRRRSLQNSTNYPFKPKSTILTKRLLPFPKL